MEPRDPAVLPFRNLKTGDAIIEVRGHDGKSASFTLQRDTSLPARSRRTEVRVLGRVPGVFLVLLETHQSSPDSPSGYCGAGVEVFLRLILTSQPSVTELLRTRVSSCLDSIETLEPVAWDEKSRTLKLTWLPFAHEKSQNELTLRLER